MQKLRLYFTLLLFFFTINILAQTISSPNKTLRLEFQIVDGKPLYSLKSAHSHLIEKSAMGFQLFNERDLATGLSCVDFSITNHSDTWKPVWGEKAEVLNSYTELTVHLKTISEPTINFNITFRLFDDGLGFRYAFPRQNNLRHFQIKEEVTEFNLGENATCFWIPGDYDSNEFVYQTSTVENINDSMAVAKQHIDSKTLINDYSVQTPFLLKKNNGWFLNIHEAALVDYPAMSLSLQSQSNCFVTNLTPDPQGSKGRLQTPCHTPWRTIIATPDAKGILESDLIVNLNEPCKLDDVSWIKPTKYMGVWWELFLPNGHTWNYCDESNIKIDQFDYKKATPNNRHGANTKNVKIYIDFAAQHNIGGLLIEGWNIGWEDWFDLQKENVFDFVTPYPDFNLPEVSGYAKSKGVDLVMHHETSGSTINYERRMDEAYDLMNKYHYPYLKSGYVGRLLPVKEYHYGQTFVNHILYSIKKCAEKKIMVNIHEAPHPTGLHRTYPNFLACESARGTEYEAFAFNRPNHTTILPFTRLVGGPMDYTPGIFQLDFSKYDANNHKTLSSTLAKQLGLYVVIYSPLQMLADLPENYENHLDAFQFLKDVPVDWKRKVVLEANPGEIVTIARQDKATNDWYVGSTSNEVAKYSTIKLNFLDPHKKYKAVIYKDSKSASYDKNPMAYSIVKKEVNCKTKLKIYCAPGGGYAISIKEITNN